MSLTTITPYWRRPDALKSWLEAIENCYHPEVTHLLFVVNEPVPKIKIKNLRVTGVQGQSSRWPSIGYFHNLGAELADTEWIMKLDLDALPNANYFKELLPILQEAGPREWFNGGMFFVQRAASQRLLVPVPRRSLLSADTYSEITRNIMTYTMKGRRDPEASNFICRKSNYLGLGGCDPNFQGWGWEDYQQIYMLERYQQGKDPLPGDITVNNVTNRCRDEISRPKAKELYRRNNWLALLHRWHPPNRDVYYRSLHNQRRNRQVLFDYIVKSRLSSNGII